MNYPNKTYVLDKVIESELGKKHHLVIVVGKNAETACNYLKEKLGFKGHKNELIWLMDTNHRTIYDQTGTKPLEVQAKILYNSTTVIEIDTNFYV